MAKKESDSTHRQGVVPLILQNFLVAPLFGLLGGAVVAVVAIIALQALLNANNEAAGRVVMTLGALIGLIAAVVITFLMIRSHAKWIEKNAVEWRPDGICFGRGENSLVAFKDITEVFIQRGGPTAEPTSIVVTSDGRQVNLPKGQGTTNAIMTRLMDQLGPAFADRVDAELQRGRTVTLPVRGRNPMWGLFVAVFFFIGAVVAFGIGLLRLGRGEGINPGPFIHSTIAILIGIVALLVHYSYATTRPVTLTRKGLFVGDREHEVVDWSSIVEIGLEPGKWFLTTKDRRVIRVANRLANGPLFPFVLIRMRPDLTPEWEALLRMINSGA